MHHYGDSRTENLKWASTFFKTRSVKYPSGNQHKGSVVVKSPSLEFKSYSSLKCLSPSASPSLIGLVQIKSLGPTGEVQVKSLKQVKNIREQGVDLKNKTMAIHYLKRNWTQCLYASTSLIQLHLQYNNIGLKLISKKCFPSKLTKVLISYWIVQ